MEFFYCRDMTLLFHCHSFSGSRSENVDGEIKSYDMEIQLEDSSECKHDWQM